MIEQLYVWEEKIRNEDNSLRQRNILLNLLEKLQTVNLNIYDNHFLHYSELLIILNVKY